MMSISKFQNSEQAAQYFEKDIDYYQKNDEIGEWHITGEMKNIYDLKGEITKESYQDFYDLITTDKKRAGFDITFSPDKSLDVVYSVADKKLQEQILQAQNRAVNKALEYAEQYITYRQRDGKGGREHFKNNGLAIAKFQHLTNRNEETKIHTHCFIANQTINSKGEIVSIDNIQLYQNQKLITQIYHNELARELQKIGLESEIADINKDIVKIKGITKEAEEAISTRSVEIEKWILENRNKYDKNITESKLRQIAVLETRQAKRVNDYNDIQNINERNRDLVKEQGIDEEYIENLILQNKQQTKENFLNAKEIVNKSLDLVSDKESIFKRESILAGAIKLNAVQGYRLDLQEIEEAINQNENLVQLDNNIYTTKEMIEIEKSIVKDIKELKDKYKAITTKNEAKEFLKEFGLTTGQEAAAEEILTNQDFLTVIQGDAGTGKTYMLKTIKEYIQNNNSSYTLQGLSFTGKAASEIEKEAGIKSTTIHSFLNAKDLPKNQIYIVDEAGLTGSKQLHKIIQKAKMTKSKIVLVGDVKQFQAISAGGMFKKLQEQNFIKTVNMTESMRAKTEVIKSLYRDIKQKQLKTAFETLDKNKMIAENENKDELLEEVKNEYIKQIENDETSVLLLASKNSDKTKLNNTIREELKKAEKLNSFSNFVIKETISLNDNERHHSNHYEIGNKVFINKVFKGVKVGEEYTIKKIDYDNNSLTILNQKNDEIEVDLTKFGDRLAQYKETEKEIALGEKIIFTKNDKKFNVKNGEIGIVKKIDGENLTIEIKEGKTIQIPVNLYNYIDYGYCVTDYKAQGQTATKVIALADLKMQSLNSLYVQVTRAKEDIKIFTDNKQELQERSENEQIKTTTLDYIKEEKEINIMLDKAEFNFLKQKTKDELKLIDPKPVLDRLGIDYKQSGNRYIFKARDERTASANLYLDNAGEWKYKDFGSGHNGTIENLIMDTTNCNYKEALEFAINTLNVRDYVEERLQELKGNNYKKVKVKVKDLKAKRKENLQKIKEQSIISKILDVKEIGNYKPTLDYLRQRGITKIPKAFKLITGEYKNKLGELKRVFGIGILTENGKGADIHFLKKLGNLKTMSLGEKGISFFKSNTESKKLAIFESKMDYAAAYQQIDFSKIDVIVANSTSNYKKVVDKIKELEPKEIKFFNQNDKAGEEFVKNIIKEAEIEKYEYIQYREDEEKQDINDLVKNGVNLELRIGEKAVELVEEQKQEKENEMEV